MKSCTKSRWLGYNALSCAPVNGIVRPKIAQNVLVGGPPGAVAFPVPVNFAIGASRNGERMPPRTLPWASVANTTGETPRALVACNRGAIAGGVPVLTHRLS